MAITATVNPLKKVAQLLGFSTKEDAKQNLSSELSIEERRQIFKVNEAYYNNNVYDRLADGGALDLINDFLGDYKDTQIKGIYNSVKRVVDAHGNNVFAGRFGQDIVIADTVDGNRAIHPNLKDAVNKIAKWSNFNQELKRYVKLGALHGTVGIRIVSKVGQGFPNDDPTKRRVYLEFEHPATIINAIRDKRGNVKQIITEYLVTSGDLSLSNRGEGVKQNVVRELATQQFTERTTEAASGLATIIPFNIGQNKLPRLTNKLGVTPYVIVHHEKKSGLFGSWAFQGSERKIDMTNALSAHIDKQIIRHIRATWAVASNGQPPANFKLNGNNVIWFELDEGSSPPAIQPMVANLSLADALSKLQQNLEEIADSLPELKSTDGKYLSGQSGETIAQLRLPAEVRIRDARTNYEDGLIRAIKIALSWGILIGLFDFGVPPTKEGADEAYENGLLDFEFEERDALPITESEKLDIQIKRNEAGVLEEVLEDLEENELDEPSGDTSNIDDTDDVSTSIEEGE